VDNDLGDSSVSGLFGDGECKCSGQTEASVRKIDAERIDRRDVDRRVVPGNATRSQCCVRRLGHEVCCEFVAVRRLRRIEQHGIEAAG